MAAMKNKNIFIKVLRKRNICHGFTDGIRNQRQRNARRLQQNANAEKLIGIQSRQHSVMQAAPIAHLVTTRTGIGTIKPTLFLE